MKTTPIIIIFAACATVVDATITLTGDAMNIGSGNYTNQSGNAAIGNNNTVEQPLGLAIGAYNNLVQDDNDYGSFALGHHNFIHGYGSIVGGSYNSVLDSASFTTGYYNYNNAPSSLVIGTGNVAEWTQNQNGIVAGKNNAAVPYSKPAHLVIGNGASTASRSNSFVVYADGDIIITKPQGDISMGIYE
jgi:hypothetical protein